ncbi:nitrilase-related carbon-nitrogen hydrolase [Dethiobacter alkaliphilus]|uniref:Nitrilase/cyanide hydratase and apolipoprotein N-acyltransferase n=1 Tax=Dethiobacter alkaliphilus AHT 1 TaxID=555088 RepID=C0GFP6_DETAL|nr:nitrilase-related carbon-nitrogen hydrolase [Dethiobacter alkaliphilus]EEG78006.1 Nitrilase/cyanide hydratase and apolipoprotein N-acyltransferase [Dethiobacter alkaliphilus AHT 1]
MKVTVYQTAPKLLDLKSNLEDVISKIHHAREKGSDLVVFPELALTGYFVGDRFHEVALRMDSDEIKSLAAASKGTAAIVGFIEESRSMNFYNSALVLVDGEIVFAYRKTNLPNYGVFEEGKLFSTGKRICTFDYMGFHIAVFICNDMWHPSLPYLGITQKADIFVTLFNSSQGSMGSEFSNIETWGVINTFYARIFGIYNICANRVGEELTSGKLKNGLPVIPPGQTVEHSTTGGDNPYRFWGGSEIVNPFGHTISKAELYNTDEIEANISSEILRKKRILLPYVKNDDPHFTDRELKRILYKHR